MIKIFLKVYVRIVSRVKKQVIGLTVKWYLQRFVKYEFKHKKKELEKIIHEESDTTFLHSAELNICGW